MRISGGSSRCLLQAQIGRRLTFLVAAALFLCAPTARAQKNLGEVLDAGATLLSPEDFKQQIVQAMLVGPTPIGGNLEIMYAANGVITGEGLPPVSAFTVQGQSMRVYGRWVIDESARICTTLSFSQMAGGTQGGTTLPPRCQYWFKLDGRYFVADSDSDRSVKVLVRAVKP